MITSDACSSSPTRSELFRTFALIGLTGFGNALPLACTTIVDKRNWMTNREFAELLALAQLLPGPNVANIATILGRRYHRFSGAAIAVFGLYLGPTVIIISIGYAYALLGNSIVIRNLLSGLVPVATGLIIGLALKLLESLPRNTHTAVVFLVTVVGITVLKLPLLALISLIALSCTWIALRRVKQ